MRTPVALIAVAVCAFASAARSESCDLSQFSTGAVRICARVLKDCVSPATPPEVAGIRRGLYEEYVGFFINDGIAHWAALDIDGQRLILVRRYAGARLGQAPQIADSANEYVREFNSGRAHWKDHVKVTPMSQDRVEKIACKAATLWRNQSNLDSIQSDGRENLVLVDGDMARRHGASGISGLAREVAAELWH